MNKKNIGRITALGIAAFTAVPSFSIVASAVNDYHGYAYASDISYYSTYTNRWYPNATAFLNDPDNRGIAITKYKVPETPYDYDSGYTWFDYTTGEYIRAADYTGFAYYVSSKNNAYNDVNGTTTAESYTVYYSKTTKMYYDTWQDAVRVSPNANYVVTHTNSAKKAAELNKGNWMPSASAAYPWYSYVTDRYYPTKAEALEYSNNDLNKVSNAYPVDNDYFNNTNSSTTVKDTSSVTIGKSKGWTAVKKAINSAKSGASCTVNMNTEVEIPESVLKALEGKNVTVSFKYSNGAIFTVNGNDIASAHSISPVVRYGSANIPSTLKKKAVKANNGIASSQLSISEDYFGATASVTVKFNSKRADCTAKLYLYNPYDNTLLLVSTSTVKSSGQCTFDNVNGGGDFIVVLS